MREIWKKIPGNDWYEASSLGRIRSIDRSIKYISFGKESARHQRSRILVPVKNKEGYSRTSINSQGGKAKIHQAHRLVWVAFHGEIPKDLQVNHKNGIKSDNSIENLELCTQKENNHHARRAGLQKNGNNGKPLFSKIEVDAIMFFYPHRVYGGYEITDILAKVFGRSRSSIQQVASRKSWVHLK